MKTFPNKINYTPHGSPTINGIHNSISHEPQEVKKETIIGIPESPEFRQAVQKVVGPIPENLPLPVPGGPEKIIERPPLTIKLSPVDISKIVNKVKQEGVMKRAIRFGIVGLGQGGGRIAGEFEALGYPTIAINTSEQDLNESPCKERVLIGTGGAGRTLSVGKEKVNTHRSEIMSAYQRLFKDIDHAIVCAGSSGGTGGGGIIDLIDTLRDYKKPVGVITTLPLVSEDTRSKKNTLSVLNELVKLNAEKKISPLIIIDNAKIEKKHPGLSTLDFWVTANKDVVKCFDLFNILSARNSAYTSLDPADYKKIITSGGCMIFGNITVTGDLQMDSISSAITTNINSGLLAEGFNLVEATTAGCIIVGSKEKLKGLQMASQEGAFVTLMNLLGSGTIFKGVYEHESVKDLEVFFMISGLGLPVPKIKSLIDEAKIEREHLEKKATVRSVDDIMKDLAGEAEDGGATQ